MLQYLLIALAILCTQQACSMAENINNLTQEVYGEDNPMNYNQMLNLVSGHYSKSPEEVENLMNRISFHETGPSQRYEPGAKQVIAGGGEGVGRGLFQFEQRYRNPDTQELEQAGGLTARNRLAKLFEDTHGGYVPDWLNQEGMSDQSIGFDASQLTADQQKMLFLGNIRMGGGRTLEGMENIPEWWTQHHHIGGGRTGEFEDSMDMYESPEEFEMKNAVTNPVHQQIFQ